VGFGSDGTFFAAEPAQLDSMQRAEACKRMAPDQVVGLLVNLDKDSASYTLSVFLDGVRAGPPQSIPPHLHGKVLFPTIAFRGMTLAANFGRGGRQLQALPFRCRMLGDAASAHTQRAAAPSSAGGRPEVVVPVGLPGEGLFAFADRYAEEHPSFVELSGRKVLEWCRSSGLANQRELDAAKHSRDRPDFAFGAVDLDDLQTWRSKLRTLAQLAGRSCLALEVGSALRKAEREELLKCFPASARKVALVAIGQPSKDFKAWTKSRIRSTYETKKALAERRRNLAEATGLAVRPEDEAPEPPATGDEVGFPPCDGEDADVPDVSEKALVGYTQFSLPTEAEGFDEVRYVWQDKAEAEKHLQAWITERKATTVVDDLAPGSWFKDKLSAWFGVRKRLRQGHMEFVEARKKAEAGGETFEVSMPDLATVLDVHSAGEQGQPLYAHFKYEDWIILSWRYELHLLVHAFLTDAADADRQGIPEDHVAHYYSLYFGQQFEPTLKLGVEGIPEILKLLKEPRLELVEQVPGRRILLSRVDREAPSEDFVSGTEKYRRDRQRRVEAGDESASLSFPRQAPRPHGELPVKAAPGRGVPSKALPGKGAAKGGKGLPVKAAPLGGKGKDGKGKVPVKGAPAPWAPAKAAPKGAKRPAEAAAAPDAAKRPRPLDLPPGRPPAPAKAPVVKAPVGKAPVGKAPVVKAPVAKRKPP